MQKISHDTLRLDNMKPTSVTHEIQTGFNRKTQQMVAESQRYSNRLTAGTPVSIQLYLRAFLTHFV
jgi:hypothetical protein